MQQSVWCHSNCMCQHICCSSTVINPGDADWLLLCSAEVMLVRPCRHQISYWTDRVAHVSTAGAGHLLKCMGGIHCSTVGREAAQQIEILYLVVDDSHVKVATLL